MPDVTRRRRTVLGTALLLGAVAGCGGQDAIGSRQGEELRASSAVLALTAGGLDDRGCGHAFTVGTEDQTVRLTLRSTTDGVPTPGRVELGAGEWIGELVVGRDLFAQWCDDVVEPGEPDVVEDHVLPVTGVLDWSVDGTGACDGPATARLTEAAVTAGEQVLPLPDLELVNDHFGCFAG